MSWAPAPETVVRVDVHRTGGGRLANAWAVLRHCWAEDRLTRQRRAYRVRAAAHTPVSVGSPVTLEDVAAVKAHVRGLVVKYHYLNAVYNDPVVPGLYDAVVLEFLSPSQRYEFERRVAAAAKASKGG